MKIVIYRLKSISGNIYIGQTNNLKRRLIEHKSKKYISDFNGNNYVADILHELPCDVNQEVVDEYEKFYIQQFIDCGFNVINKRIGGNKSACSESSKEKISNSLKKWYSENVNPKKGVSRSKEIGDKISAAKKGKKTKRIYFVSEETRKKLSIAAKKRPPFSQETRMKISESNKSRKRLPLTDETKRKISKTLKNKSKSQSQI